MDRLEAMRLLLRVIERGSFSAAARELGVPLATVSRKVNDLEAHLGTRLLNRTTRKVVASEAGLAYAASARRILEEIEEAERTAAGEYHAPRGALILTAPVLFGRLYLLPVVGDFLAAYPEIDVKLVLSDQVLHLLDEHVDLAARIGRLPDSGMVATRIGALRTVVCASPQLIAAQGAPQRPEDLAALPCVNFDYLAPAATWTFQNSGGRGITEVAVKPRLAVSTAEAAVWAAVQGIGFTRVLHYQCAEALREGRLRIVLEDCEVDTLPVHLLHAGQAALPSKMRAFLDFAVPRLRATLTAL